MSKFISLVLRHRPEEIGLTLEPGGWASIAELVSRSRKVADAPVTGDRIRDLVATQKKPRFSLSTDGERIRANYGHSIDVDLDLKPARPPATLYHGTAERNLTSILREGLEPRSRRHVHLSTDPEDAREVGRRHGRPRLLQIDAGRLHGRGHRFYPAAEGVWLTGFLPAEHLELLED